MKHTFYFLFALLVISCQQKNSLPQSTNSAKDLIQQSIHYHDPKGNWEELQTEITMFTRFWAKDGSIQESNTIVGFNHPNQSFYQESEVAGILVRGEVSPDTCFNNPVKKITEEEKNSISSALGCESITFYRDYYSYLIGLPMKLDDPKATIHPEILEREYDGKKFDVVKVQYEPLDESHVWYFYFDQKDHSFQLCKFTSNEDENKGGEYIIYNQEFDYQGIKLKQQQVWLYNTPTLDTLAVDRLNFSKL